MIERIDGIVGAFDSFRVEEAYNWRDDIMEIASRIVHETDEARLNNIAEHFEVDLSEIREFLEMKRKKMQKPTTNADRIRAMSDEDLAGLLDAVQGEAYLLGFLDRGRSTFTPNGRSWLDWLKSPVEEKML